MRWIVSVLIGVGCAAIIAAGFWVNGFDFDQRGPDALKCYLFSMTVGWIAFMIASICPAWDK